MMTLYLLSLSGESYLLSSRREGVILKVLRADKGAGCVCVCLHVHRGRALWDRCLPSTPLGADSAGTAARHGARHGARGFGPLPLHFGGGNTQSLLPVGCCRLPVLLALCSGCHLSAHGDLTPLPAARHGPAVRSLLPLGSLLSCCCCSASCFSSQMRGLAADACVTRQDRRYLY